MTDIDEGADMLDKATWTGVIWEEGTVFRAATGAVSVVAGVRVRSADINVFVDGVRLLRVQEVTVKDLTEEGAVVRSGTVRFSPKTGAPPTMGEAGLGTMEVKVCHPESGHALCSYRTASCVWTRDQVDTDMWCFRGAVRH